VGALAASSWFLDRAKPALAGDATEAVVPDVEIALSATRAKAQVMRGDATEVWTFRGSVVRGDVRTLQNMPSEALGPTIRVRTRQKVRIVLANDIPQETIVHWHGLHVPAAADGHPRLAIRPGGRYVYEFEVKGPAGTYWYHAHPDKLTGEQVYRGMAGLFIVEDPATEASLLPAGEFDVGLVIQDRLFDANNQLVYLTSPMERMTGFLGDRVVVNGVVDYALRAAARPYRLRIVNGSNSRIYRLAWADGTPLTVVGTDGGLLEAPVQKPSVMLAPAERLQLWIDLGHRPIGSELALVSLPFDAPAPMGPMRMGASRSPAQGAPMAVLRVRVDRPSSDRPPLPARLAPLERYRLEDAVNAASPRRIVATMQHMAFGLNGRSFEMDGVANDEHVKLGTLEAWEFDNPASAPMGGMGMMMTAMPHPFHVHGGQFQVLRREGVTHAGYIDDGWKDTVLVMPGERATVLMRFRDYAGVFLYHCHNLEHEDGGMMRNFAIDV
jgi:FtsP/CotA-like multicopper oxidase with cupredoxin domain